MRITNEYLSKEIIIGEKYLITDDMWGKKECVVIGVLDKLIIAEYNPFTDKVELDITENTETLYVNTNGTEIPILVDEITSIEIA